MRSERLPLTEGSACGILANRLSFCPKSEQKPGSRVDPPLFARDAGLRPSGTEATSLLDALSEAAAVADPRDAARTVGLRYVTDSQPGISRRRAGKGFAYFYPDGRKIEDKEELSRIRAIVIPPAWSDVWICPYAHGHLQATGRDDRGRKQYRYHPLFREIRESAKFGHMMVFARALPALRATVRRRPAPVPLHRQKVVAHDQGSTCRQGHQGMPGVAGPGPAAIPRREWRATGYNVLSRE
jgi:hypothetical protein